MFTNKATNKHFSKNYDHFMNSCEAIGIDPTRRQASKWRSQQGRAWNEGRIKLKENKKLNKSA